MLREIYFKAPGLSLDEATSALGGHWGWMLAAGIAYIWIGSLALGVPAASTMGFTFALAGLFSATGIVQLIHAVKLRRKQGGIMRFLQSLLAIGAGALIFLYPGIGMYGVGLTLSFYFFIGAAMNWILAQAISPGRARMWLYLSSMTSFLLGFYIVFTFPLSSYWVPGILLGINFIFDGSGLIGLALATRALMLKGRGNETPKHTPDWSRSTTQPT